jgi:hypothetical protein
MPCRWSEGPLPDFAGRVRFRRRFGIPRQIAPPERVWLTFAGAEESVDVWLNGQFLGRQEDARNPFEYEVTSLLRDRNELVVEVEARASNDGLWGEAALEIRCPAFLRSVRVRAVGAGDQARLHIGGEVVGSSDRPLELYVVLDRSTVAYATVEADAAGRPFEMMSGELPLEGVSQDPPASGRHQVQVELVYGACAWFTVKQTIEFPDANSRTTA